MREQSLENVLLKNGLKATQTHQSKIFPTYTNEIEEFNKDLKKKEKKIPF